MNWNIQNSLEEYRIHEWSDDYFSINEKGSICARPYKDQRSISIEEILKEVKASKISFPLVIRFHDILKHRVHDLFQTFNTLIDKHHYQGKYQGVYPIKVNQLREVVEEIISSDHPIGLEAGSKTEALAVSQFNLNPDSICIFNGFKDKDYIKTTLLNIKAGKKTAIVIEKYQELQSILDVSEEMQIEPILGFRVKLSSKGSGPWAESSGETSKFGLNINEILKLCEDLKSQNKLHLLNLLHFHIGSQVSTITSVQNATKEAMRIYTSLSNMGVPLKYIDIGGGLGVNYEGVLGISQTAINYKTSDYIETIIKIIKETADEAKVSHPNIISESGRYLTALHSCIVTNLVNTNGTKPYDFQSEHQNTVLFKKLLENLKEENYAETFFNAKRIKKDTYQLFLENKAKLNDKAEVDYLFKKLLFKIKELDIKDPTFETFESEILDQTVSQYICNFSIFQSIADSWAIKQVLPIAPITKHHEYPSEVVKIYDITCDSDGKVSQYLSPTGKRKFLRLHKAKPEDDYPIAFFMTGAYQDIMGDMHNLFGRLNEVHVFYDSNEPGNFYLEEIIKGNQSEQILSTMQYNPENMAFNYKRSIDAKVKKGEITPRKGVKYIDTYEEILKGYTYLNIS